MKIRKLFALTFIFTLSVQSLHAASATWNLNPGSGDWNTAANWTPVTVPNGPVDTATFAVSNTTGIALSANTEVNGIVFNSGASAFTISAGPNLTLTIGGVGIRNDSGTQQNFAITPNGSGPGMVFHNSATAGSLTAFTNNVGTVIGNSFVQFLDTATAADRNAIVDKGATASRRVVTEIRGATPCTTHRAAVVGKGAVADSRVVTKTRGATPGTAHRAAVVDKGAIAGGRCVGKTHVATIEVEKGNTRAGVCESPTAGSRVVAEIRAATKTAVGATVVEKSAVAGSRVVVEIRSAFYPTYGGLVGKGAVTI